MEGRRSRLHRTDDEQVRKTSRHSSALFAPQRALLRVPLSESHVTVTLARTYTAGRPPSAKHSAANTPDSVRSTHCLREGVLRRHVTDDTMFCSLWIAGVVRFRRLAASSCPSAWIVTSLTRSCSGSVESTSCSSLDQAK